LNVAAPGLCTSGASALVWRRLKSSPAFAGSDGAERVRNGAWAQARADAAHEAAIFHLSALLEAAKVRAVMFKGWAAARAYAEPWLRPGGDIDLIAPPADLQAIEAALTPAAMPEVSVPAAGKFVIDAGARRYEVDLHARLDPAYGIEAEAVAARAAPLHGALLAPCPEHHLRLVAVHLLKHGGWRPLWLCDVAAMVEAAAPAFDWRLCLGEDDRAAGWIAAVIGAASELLGCRASHAPIPAQAPAWLVRSLLAAWDDPDPSRYRTPRLAALTAPQAWVAARWPGPIRGAFLGGGAASVRPGALRQAGRMAADLAEGAPSHLQQGLAQFRRQKPKR
jgi:hypothetical protein